MESIMKTLKVTVVIGLIIFIPTLLYTYFTDWRYAVPENSQIVIRLSRGSAMGGVSYEVSLYEDGTVVYDGKRFVGASGVRKENIGPDKVRELAKAMEQAGYFELDDGYYPNDVFDGDFVLTYVKSGQREKEIVRHTAVFIPELISLENLIDTTTDSQKWVQCHQSVRLLCGFNPYVIAPNLMFFIMAELAAWNFVQKHRTVQGIILGLGIIILYGLIIWFGNWSSSTKMQGLNLATFELIALLPVGLFFVWWHNRRVKIDATSRGSSFFGPFLQ